MGKLVGAPEFTVIPTDHTRGDETHTDALCGLSCDELAKLRRGILGCQLARCVSRRDAQPDLGGALYVATSSTSASIITPRNTS